MGLLLLLLLWLLLLLLLQLGLSPHGHCIPANVTQRWLATLVHTEHTYGHTEPMISIKLPVRSGRHEAAAAAQARTF
jgi:hypothetical protein